MHFHPLISLYHPFQLSIKNGKTTISINLVTESNDAAEQFEKLRDERDRLNSYCTS